MKNIFLIVSLIISSSSVFAQNKHITFDNYGEIQKNSSVKVDTILLINGDKGTVNDTIFSVSLEDQHVFFISKKDKENYSFFPYMNVNTQRYNNNEQTTSLIVFNRTGLICLCSLIVILLFVVWRQYKKIRKQYYLIIETIHNIKKDISQKENYKEFEHQLKSIQSKTNLLFEQGKDIEDFIEENRRLYSKILQDYKNKEKEKRDLQRAQIKPEEVGLSHEEIKLLDKSVDDFSFPQRALIALKANSVYTIHDLIRIMHNSNRKTLLQFQNLGVNTIEEIEKILVSNNFIEAILNKRKWTDLYKSKFDAYFNALIEIENRKE